MDGDDQVSLLTRFAIYTNNKAPLVVEEKSTMFYPGLKIEHVKHCIIYYILFYLHKVKKYLIS